MHEIITRSRDRQWSYYLKRWYVFLLSVLFFGAAGYYYLSYLVVPDYRVSSTLLLRESSESSGSQLPAAFNELNLVQPVAKVEDAVEILKSDSLMYNSLTALDQGVRYYCNGSEVYGPQQLTFSVSPNLARPIEYETPATIYLLGDSLYEIQAPGEADRQGPFDFGEEITFSFATFTVFGNTAAVAASGTGAATDFHFVDIDALRDDYSLRFDVSQVNIKSNVINLGLVDPIPQRGVDLMNQIIGRYQQDLLLEKNQLALSTIDLIDERLSVLVGELSGVEQSVEKYKRNNELTDVDSEAEMYLNRANDYSKQLSDFQLRIDILNSIERYLKQDGDNFSAVPSSLSIDDATLATLISQYNDLLLRRQDLLSRSTEKNPLVVNTEQQLGLMRSKLVESVQNVRSGLQLTRDNLRVSSQSFERQIRRVPSMERDLIEIQRQQGIKNSLYLYLLQKREEAVLSLATGVPALRIISPPRAAAQPVRSKRSVVYLSCVLLGIFVPFALMKGGRKLLNRVTNPQEVTDLVSVPLIATIGHSSDQDELISTQVKSSTEVAELFTLLTYNLKFSLPGQAQIILVTSAKAGEGKTFISKNLAASYALAGKRAVYVNMDLRKPTQAEGAQAAKGVTSYLNVDSDVEVMDHLNASATVAGLYLMNSGPSVADAARLLRSPNMSGLIQALRDAFDYVIIDSSPVGMVSDSLAFSDLVDATLYVVRAGVTKQDELNVLQDIYDRKKLPRPVVVLNDYKDETLTYGYPTERQ